LIFYLVWDFFIRTYNDLSYQKELGFLSFSTVQNNHNQYSKCSILSRSY